MLRHRDVSRLEGHLAGRAQAALAAREAGLATALPSEEAR